jgi:hypothetical protein
VGLHGFTKWPFITKHVFSMANLNHKLHQFLGESPLGGIGWISIKLGIAAEQQLEKHNILVSLAAAGKVP